MYPIIALWSHPRSMSTATERVMRERADLTCFHEPFMYDYYINRKVRRMPHFEAEKNHPITYEDVRDMILEKAQSGPVFFKDMSYYVMPHVLEDKAFCDRLTNCFLIRDPIASIPSYFKLDAEVTCDEIGLEAQSRHYDGLCALSDEVPVVIRAEDIRADTSKAIGALWKQIGLPAADHAFEWQDEKPADWKQVAGWHGDVSASKGIRPITPEEVAEQKVAFETMCSAHPNMRVYLDHHMPYYKALGAHALKP
ncbi:sulfotransferase-like domain-containing protein [Roseovarius pelagicus]|uniref:Sulfotransferase family protein n=1 Tax=Roseovarius pelagicus TaxID=2980108 RepID=A0ABY6D8S8_9RHOB|nr:hypothetical protein [Roseovarius pelagicus]UXX82544.1 hypothetical protein N7U68_15800 [Roseovarius pelagicus]